MASKKKVKAIPAGLHTITPHLVLKDTVSAIKFYKKAFGAQQETLMKSPDGKAVWHAAVRIGDSAIFMGDEGMGPSKSAEALGGSPASLQINTEDVDGLFKRATKAGAKVKMPPADMFWGDRYATVEDPYGNTWALCQHIQDLTPAEMKKAGKEFAKQMQAQQQKQ